MNKISIFFLMFSLLVLNCFSHEAAISYTIKGTNSYEEDDIKGWSVDFVTLEWGDNDFSDYAIGLKFSFNQQYSMNKTMLTKAWKRFFLTDFLNLTLGKQQYSFGVFESAGCG